MLSDRVLNAVAAWLNGDPGHAYDEGLMIANTYINGQELVVTFVPTEPGLVPFQACFVLTSMELQSSALRRQATAKQNDVR